MRQNAEEKKNWIMRAALVLLIMVLISTRFVGGLYARFTVEGTGSDNARAAAFAFVTQDGENSHYLGLSGIQKPGDKETYRFTVSNRNGTAVSEVAEKYGFTVQLNGSMPLVCTISRESGEVLTEVLTAKISKETQALPVIVSADAGQFSASTECIDTYSMTVEWPEDANEAKYASRSAVAEVVLTVTAEQID